MADRLLSEVYWRLREAVAELTSRQVALLAVGAVTAAYLVARRRGARLRLAPGPRGLPLLGNALQLFYSEHRAEKNFAEMTKIYGPVIRNNIFGKEFIVLHGVDIIREALVTKADDFANRPVIWSGSELSDGGKDIAFGQPSPIWKYQRQIVHQAIRKYASGENLERIVRAIHVNVGEMLRAHSGPLDVKPVSQYITYNLFMSLCFGGEYGPEDTSFVALQDLVNELQTAMRLGTPVDFMPSLAYCPLMWPQMNGLKSIFSRWKNMIKQNIKMHTDGADKGGAGGRQNLTEYILAQEVETSDGSYSQAVISEDYLVNTVSDVFGAGIDTINSTLMWVIGYMAKYPEVQARLQKEIDAVYTPGSSLLDMRNKIPYVDAVLCEVMRLETAAPLGIPLETGRDTSVGGYDVPRGCLVLINLWALHRSADYWQRPELFDPERFLDEAGELRMRMPHFLPFSAGRRHCIGEVLTRSALFMMVVLLYHSFTFSVPAAQPHWGLAAEDVPMISFPRGFQVEVRARH